MFFTFINQNSEFPFLPMRATCAVHPTFLDTCLRVP